MSSYLEITIGAGVKIPNQKEKTKKTSYSCGAHIHRNNINKFCGTCGQEIKEIEEEGFYFMDASDLIGNDNMTSHNHNGNTYLFSNIIGIGTINVNEDNVLTINDELINNKIKEFKNRHRDDISVLEKKIGFPVIVEFFFLYRYL